MEYNGCNRFKIDCAKCCGLCCTALYFAKSEGFPQNKAAGVPCQHLCADFKCEIHDELSSRKMKGCMAYDCFGAGQWVTQHVFKGADWRQADKALMFDVFIKAVQLHQMLWYLSAANDLLKDLKLMKEIDGYINEIVEVLNESAVQLAACDVERLRHRVNQRLKQACGSISCQACGKHIIGHDAPGRNFKKADLSGHDFSMCLLMAADLRGCRLTMTNFLGADLRDTDIRGTDLSHSCFLTQGQINAARGNAQTKLPANLSMPAAWLKETV